ncbi:survival of motor neuron-related-splicing factor 30 isoform X1 [Ischnura elegans]|uniref:survival of motor neuron-related-splicing factor 30 isoform X1 n=1 Tax=Ischnura elegans TaxID=197161 RepID=UPI001ED88C56|nr:survival of motor neuron-related-splicing factor 30 isoform X1 [Ischnura elegans]
MAEDLQGNLQNYKLQLQQVEAALTTDPENGELLKLKVDLEEVIELTRDLIKTQLLEAKGAEAAASSSFVSEAEDDSSKDEDFKSSIPSKTDWKVGEKCLALWNANGEYYEATIEDLGENGICTVKFCNYQTEDVTNVSLLRELSQEGVPKVTHPGDLPADSKSKKQLVLKQREYLKKKKQRKQQRFKQLEEEREGEKNKWLAFSHKTTGKKGIVKKSIFASPDNVNGRVGIGTCGIGGRPMTEYTAAEKWRKGV